MSLLTALGEGLYVFDLLEQGMPGRSSAYLYDGKKKALVETGSSPSLARIVAALAERGLRTVDLDYVIVTHVHLDHAGGAGALSLIAPHATFVAHPRAARHLADPSRLLAGARAVYGEALLRLFGDVLPIAASSILVREDGETLDLGDRRLTFYDTPGHAKHHFSIHDPERAAVFSGDALGIRYVTSFTGWPFEFVWPSTSPTDFDPDGVAYTVDKLSALGIRTVYHTHFGPSPADEAFAGVLIGARTLADAARSAYRPGMTWQDMARAANACTLGHLRAAGHQEPLELGRLGVDLELNARGLLHYASRL